MRPSRETHERRAECEQRQYNCTLEKGREMRTMRPPTPVDCNGQEFHPVNQNNIPQYMNLKTKIQQWDDLRQAYKYLKQHQGTEFMGDNGRRISETFIACKFANSIQLQECSNKICFDNLTSHDFRTAPGYTTK